MNNVIKRELDKIRAPMSEYDDDTTKIHISMKPQEEAMYEIGKSYLVQLEDYIVNEPPNFTLSSNWNKGVKPQSNHMLIYLKEQSGKMLKVLARDYNIEEDVCLEGIYYDLWLPLGGLVKIREVQS